jgi:hypothetical protein
MREAAEEVCAALAAVGDCLSLFGWVVGFEAFSVLLTLCAEYFGYKYDGTKVQEEVTAAARATLFSALEWEQQHQFTVLLLLWALGLWAWPSLRQYLAERANWLALAIREEAHDVRINRELRRFEKHCGPQECLTPEDLLQRDELAHILTDIGYDPEPGQLDALLGAALAQQRVGALSLRWLLQEIEALLGRTDAPTIRQRILRQQQGAEKRKNSRMQRQAAATADRSPSPAPPDAASGSVASARSPSPSLGRSRDRRSFRPSIRHGDRGDTSDSDRGLATIAQGLNTLANIADADVGIDQSIDLDDANDEPVEVSGVAAAAATMATLLPLASPPPVDGRAVGSPSAASTQEFSPRRTRSSVRRRKAS